jgi:hypothetical protein
MTLTMKKTSNGTLQTDIRTAVQRPATLGDHAAFTLWIAAYVAVLAIVFAPKGTFDSAARTQGTGQGLSIAVRPQGGAP